MSSRGVVQLAASIRPVKSPEANKIAAAVEIDVYVNSGDGDTFIGSGPYRSDDPVQLVVKMVYSIYDTFRRDRSVGAIRNPKLMLMGNEANALVANCFYIDEENDEQFCHLKSQYWRSAKRAIVVERRPEDIIKQLNEILGDGTYQDVKGTLTLINFKLEYIGASLLPEYCKTIEEGNVAERLWDDIDDDDHDLFEETVDRRSTSVSAHNQFGQALDVAIVEKRISQTELRTYDATLLKFLYRLSENRTAFIDLLADQIDSLCQTLVTMLRPSTTASIIGIIANTMRHGERYFQSILRIGEEFAKCFNAADTVTNHSINVIYVITETAARYLDDVKLTDHNGLAIEFIDTVRRQETTRSFLLSNAMSCGSLVSDMCLTWYRLVIFSFTPMFVTEVDFGEAEKLNAMYSNSFSNYENICNVGRPLDAVSIPIFLYKYLESLKSRHQTVSHYVNVRDETESDVLRKIRLFNVTSKQSPLLSLVPAAKTTFRIYLTALRLLTGEEIDLTFEGVRRWYYGSSEFGRLSLPNQAFRWLASNDLFDMFDIFFHMYVDYYTFCAPESDIEVDRVNEMMLKAGTSLLDDTRQVSDLRFIYAAHLQNFGFSAFEKRLALDERKECNIDSILKEESNRCTQDLRWKHRMSLLKDPSLEFRLSSDESTFIAGSFYAPVALSDINIDNNKRSVTLTFQEQSVTQTFEGDDARFVFIKDALSLLTKDMRRVSVGHEIMNRSEPYMRDVLDLKETDVHIRCFAVGRPGILEQLPPLPPPLTENSF